MKKLIFSTIVSVISLTGCNNSNSWTVKGSVDNGAGRTIVLEASDNGRWYALDSAKIDNSGKFAMTSNATSYPDIYRLNLDGQSIYFPIDSIETVAITGNAEAFASEYSMSGSTEADIMMHVESRIKATIAAKGAEAATDSVLKRELGGMLLGNPAGIVSYYIINRKIGNAPLFNPTDKNDLKIIGAVANAFSSHRPNDPRTGYLKSLFLSNKRAMQTTLVSDTLYVNETPLLDINLSDNTGESHSLKEVAKQNKTVILNFTLYNVDASPAFNLELAKIYDKYRNSGLEIYQVSVDNDEFQWKQSAKNLPWITVYNSTVDGATNLLNYNVSNLPATFIINNGEVVARIEDITTLDKELKKYIR